MVPPPGSSTTSKGISAPCCSSCVRCAAASSANSRRASWRARLRMRRASPQAARFLSRLLRGGRARVEVLESHEVGRRLVEDHAARDLELAVDAQELAGLEHPPARVLVHLLARDHDRCTPPLVARANPDRARRACRVEVAPRALTTRRALEHMECVRLRVAQG